MSSQLQRTADSELRERARAVIPNGMYGHQNASYMPENFPQFFARGEGSHLWDVDGNEYIDYLCAYGPILLGYRHPAVDEAAAAAQDAGDCFNGPSAKMVELAELLVEITPWADWAWMAKNGTDATVYAASISRTATGRQTILRAHGAYHGASPTWITGGDMAAQADGTIEYEYNDIELPGGAFAAQLIAIRADVAFDVRWSWLNLIQYDNESESVGINSRLRWTPRAGQDLFIVLNHGFESTGAFAGLRSLESQLSVKYTQTFRF